VTIPERMPANVRPIAKTKHLHSPPQVRKRLAAQKRAQHAARGGGLDARLDLTIAAPNRVFVRGRGVDAELSGELKVKGRAADPTVVGGFQMRRGRLLVAGKRLDFARGNLVFSGALQPELDFLAQTQAADALVKIGLAGPAAQPDFAVTSEPDLPQDEIFARLLFGKSSGSLAPAQLIQLALVAAQFAGGDGNDAFEKMRRQLGVDSLDVDLGGDAGVGVGVRKAINDRISIGVKAAARPKDSGVSVDVDITRRLRLQGEATAGGGASVGVGFEMEY
jgi:translocation and assembly module TamB